jgi:hypothetical protein
MATFTNSAPLAVVDAGSASPTLDAYGLRGLVTDARGLGA